MHGNGVCLQPAHERRSVFTLTEVALNDPIMLFAFAPIAALLLGASAIAVPWRTLIIAGAIYIALPFVIAQALRARVGARGGRPARDALLACSGPWPDAASLATFVLPFTFQGEPILREQLAIAMLAGPLLLQVFFIAGLECRPNRNVGEKHSVAGPSALIGASDFFELAVAAAISLSGFGFGAARVTVVGVLIEAPLLLLVVRVVNARGGRYRGNGARAQSPP